VAGGVRVEEPGADLAVALAVASAVKNVPLGAGTTPLACFGEIGLTGELRTVAHAERRLAEAEKFGLAPVLYPGERTPTLRTAVRAALAAPASRVAA
jgi:DNA repair protein RadA/Sms